MKGPRAHSSDLDLARLLSQRLRSPREAAGARFEPSPRYVRFEARRVVPDAVPAWRRNDQAFGPDVWNQLLDGCLAAADGRVVYAGSGIRGYGNLLIVKHNNTYLTAYAHNQTLLVKEDQVVRRGQKIAEMGATDAERVQLHFEIRREGKPVDPTKLLPPR